MQNIKTFPIDLTQTVDELKQKIADQTKTLSPLKQLHEQKPKELTTEVAAKQYFDVIKPQFISRIELASLYLTLYIKLLKEPQYGEVANLVRKAKRELSTHFNDVLEEVESLQQELAKNHLNQFNEALMAMAVSCNKGILEYHAHELVDHLRHQRWHAFDELLIKFLYDITYNPKTLQQDRYNELASKFFLSLISNLVDNDQPLRALMICVTLKNIQVLNIDPIEKQLAEKITLAYKKLNLLSLNCNDSSTYDRQLIQYKEQAKTHSSDKTNSMLYRSLAINFFLLNAAPHYLLKTVPENNDLFKGDDGLNGTNTINYVLFKSLEWLHKATHWVDSDFENKIIMLNLAINYLKEISFKYIADGNLERAEEFRIATLHLSVVREQTYQKLCEVSLLMDDHQYKKLTWLNVSEYAKKIFEKAFDLSEVTVTDEAENLFKAALPLYMQAFDNIESFIDFTNKQDEIKYFDLLFHYAQTHYNLGYIAAAKGSEASVQIEHFQSALEWCARLTNIELCMLDEDKKYTVQTAVALIHHDLASVYVTMEKLPLAITHQQQAVDLFLATPEDQRDDHTQGMITYTPILLVEYHFRLLMKSLNIKDITELMTKSIDELQAIIKKLDFSLNVIKKLTPTKKRDEKAIEVSFLLAYSHQMLAIKCLYDKTRTDDVKANNHFMIAMKTDLVLLDELKLIHNFRSYQNNLEDTVSRLTKTVLYLFYNGLNDEIKENLNIKQFPSLLNFSMIFCGEYSLEDYSILVGFFKGIFELLNLFIRKSQENNLANIIIKLFQLDSPNQADKHRMINKHLGEAFYPLLKIIVLSLILAKKKDALINLVTSLQFTTEDVSVINHHPVAKQLFSSLLNQAYQSVINNIKYEFTSALSILNTLKQTHSQKTLHTHIANLDILKRKIQLVTETLQPLFNSTGRTINVSQLKKQTPIISDVAKKIRERIATLDLDAQQETPTLTIGITPKLT